MKKQKIILGVIGILVLGGIVGGCDGEDTPDDKPLPTHSGPVEGDDGSLGGPTEKQKPAPTKTKKASAPTFSNGDYIIGEDMPAGTYVSKGAKDGGIGLCAVTSKPVDSSRMPIIKAGERGARVIVAVTEADGTLTITGCEPFIKR